MFKEWGKRDWIWTIVLLIFIIIMIVANKIENPIVETNFSIVSSAASMALALLAIGYAFKQDSDNQNVNSRTRDLLSDISQAISKVDYKVDYITPSLIMEKTDEAKQKFVNVVSQEGEKENYSKEEVNEMINKYNNLVKDSIYDAILQQNIELDMVNNNEENILRQEKVHNRKIIKMAMPAFMENKDITEKELVEYLSQKNMHISYMKAKELIDRFKK